MVGYGSLSDPALAEGASPAPAPSANGSIERKAYPSSNPSTMVGGVDSAMGNGSDTNNNSSDFILRDTSDPQNASSDPESDMMLDTARGLVLNEILYNTASGGGWIEIYNASTTANILLTDWTIEIATTTATNTANIYTFPAVTASSSSFVLVEWNESGTNIINANLATLYTGAQVNMSTVGGDVALKNNSEVIIDYIQYGGSGKSNETSAVSLGQWTSGDFKPNSNYNESIARQGTMGDDYNDSIDWTYMSSPSPGYPNMGGDSTAPTAVTNVILIDADNANYGLDDMDVRVAWTPASAQDSSFDRYELYILPDTTALDTSQHSAYENIYGQYYYEAGAITASTSQLFMGFNDFRMTMDSAGTTFSDGGNYRAYIVAVDFSGNRSSAVGSASAILTSDAGGADTVDPMIDHMNIWEARVGDNLTIYARMADDREQCDIATRSEERRVGKECRSRWSPYH